MFPPISPAGLFHAGADTVFLALFHDPWLYSGCYSTFPAMMIAFVFGWDNTILARFRS